MECARNYGIPLSDDDMKKAAFYLPPEDGTKSTTCASIARCSTAICHGRVVDCPALAAPSLDEFSGVSQRHQRPRSVVDDVVVRILSKLLKSKDLGRASCRSCPTKLALSAWMACSVRRESIHRTASTHRSITKASRTIAKRRTARHLRNRCDGLVHGRRQRLRGARIADDSVLIFYSMFGFQRVADMIWACGDMMCRGFLLGGTASTGSMAKVCSIRTGIRISAPAPFRI